MATRLAQIYIPVIAATLLFIICSVHLWLPIGAAPTNSNTEKEPDEAQRQIQEEENAEEQLHSLKASSSGQVAMAKSDTQTFKQVNGKSELHRIHEETVDDVSSGKTVAKVSQEILQTAETPESKPKTVVKTEVDIPSKGIHQVTVNKKAKLSIGGKESSDSAEALEDYFSPYDSIQYTPTDMAEYIQRTGDDEGVALAVEELMKEGMISRNEAVNYLEDVKNELMFVQEHQFANGRDSKMLNQHKLLFSHQANERHPSVTLPMASVGRKAQRLSAATPPSSESSGLSKHASFSWLSRPKFASKTGEGERQEEDEEEEDRGMQRRRNGHNKDEIDEIDYRNLLERLRIADFLYKEYSLEEVIYQLAKEMFTQSIIKGNRDAEESLQRFSNFLQEETAEGRISKEEETKILDVVMTALMDAVGSSHQQQEYRESQTERSHPIQTNKPERIQDLKNEDRVAKHEKLDTKAVKTKNLSTFDGNKQSKDHKVYGIDVKSMENVSAKV